MIELAGSFPLPPKTDRIHRKFGTNGTVLYLHALCRNCQWQKEREEYGREEFHNFELFEFKDKRIVGKQ